MAKGESSGPSEEDRLVQREMVRRLGLEADQLRLQVASLETDQLKEDRLVQLEMLRKLGLEINLFISTSRSQG